MDEHNLYIETTVAAAFAYVAQVAVPAPGGAQWAEADGQRYDDLYSGTAGVLLAAAQAIAAIQDAPEVMRAAELARDRLLYLAEHADDSDLLPDDGLFSGWAGLLVALAAWGRAHPSDAEPCFAAAATIRRRVVERARSAPGDGPVDIIDGHAGVLLGLLDAEPEPDQDDALTHLVQLLLDARLPTPDGLHWHGTGEGYVSLGFSHGTAGIAYALALASQRLARPDLLDIAREAARGLIAVGGAADRRALPVRIPPRGGDQLAVMFGWCHGTAGTLRLFDLLNAIDPRPEWTDAVMASIDAIHRSKLPERLFPGYWDNVGRCCGTASVGQLLTERAASSGDRDVADWARRLAEDVLSRTHLGTGPDGQPSACWSNTDFKAADPELPPEAGLMQGAAGIAAWLATLSAVGARRPVPRIAPAWI